MSSPLSIPPVLLLSADDDVNQYFFHLEEEKKAFCETVVFVLLAPERRGETSDLAGLGGNGLAPPPPPPPIYSTAWKERFLLSSILLCAINVISLASHVQNMSITLYAKKSHRTNLVTFQSTLFSNILVPPPPPPLFIYNPLIVASINLKALFNNVFT